MIADIQELAHDLTFKAVLIKAAVAGIHPATHTTTLAKPSQNTSFSC
jgi:hypothetical protein